MNKMKDSVVKLTIQADSSEEAEELAKSEMGVKKVLSTNKITSIFEIIVIKEMYGKHDLGYCKDCGEDLSCRAEFMVEKCDACM